MDPQKITELAKLLRCNGDKILSSEFTLTLSGSLLQALNDSFTLITDSIEIGGPQQFQVVKPNNSKSHVFRDLQLIYDFVQKTTLLCIVHYPTEEYFSGVIDISKFRALQRLETRKIDVRQIVGIQPLRSQLQHLICIKSLQSVDDIITYCGGDHSQGFVWNELKSVDFSYNNLQSIDTSLEFAQYLQQLNLRHNKLRSVEAIKWLPHLKSLDLSYNCLQYIPQLHADAYKRLQTLNISNNFIEDLMGVIKMDALTELDLSDNFLLDHTCLFPLSALMTLKYLNLYGNPLHCHPKHRLATAQFLHKNTATVKFVLDLEPLSRNEKAVTGKQQSRLLGGHSHFRTNSSSVSISSISNRGTPSSQTPASSVGSLHSFKFQEATTSSIEALTTSVKKKAPKIRTVDIEEDKSAIPPTNDEHDIAAFAHDDESLVATSGKKKSNKKQDKLTQSLLVENNEHLETKKHIENLRGKYGSEWLQSGNAEMIHSVLGIETAKSTSTDSTSQQTNISRQLFNDYLGEFSAAAMQNSIQITPADDISNTKIHTSTPISNDINNETPTLTPFESSAEDQQQSNNTLYKSLNATETTSLSNANDNSLYKTIESDNISGSVSNEASKESEIPQVDEKEDKLKNIYATDIDAASEDSEPEEEETYIVYTNKNSAALFLTLSENFLREKDTWAQRTMTKWSLKILESCERIKDNMIRINFDTVKADKKERIYTVEDGLCQELEKKLRDILSKRDLSEMNQTIFRCVNCSCQFSRENKAIQIYPIPELRCPDCNSTFIAEVHEVPKSLEKSRSFANEEKLSPAAIVEESPVSTPLVVVHSASQAASIQTQESIDSIDVDVDQSNSIGSANSLNESSSCSKISSVHSQSSFGSNQSVVGSTNSERDLGFNVNCESDVDIISNPSQSSIEVLDQIGWGAGEERRISQQPNLETIDDNSYKQSFTDWPVNGPNLTTDATPINKNLQLEKEKVDKHPVTATVSTNSTGNALTHLQLTESSSSGSVTDSICTTYATNKGVEVNEKSATHNLLASESLGDKKEQPKVENPADTKKEEGGITSMFGALFQSTNILMSSSKKLIDAEANVKSGEKLPAAMKSVPKSSNSLLVPYKFNYTDFNDIDHRLKLYFYQTKFEDEGEHFKCVVRGRIFNEITRTMHMGVVILSTSRLYLMEAFAPENDVITKWLRQVLSVSIDRLECIQLLPWKLGFSFTIRDWGSFLLLLQDILRTDSLLLYFANNSLPEQCELLYQPAECITKRLNTAVGSEKLKMLALLNDCEITCDNAKRSFQISGLLITDTYLYLTSNKLLWLTQQTSSLDDLEIECCVKQLMSNLVEVEEISDNVRVIKFLDETQNKCENWRLTFETKENADSSLKAIDQAWQKLFGVSLFGA